MDKILYTGDQDELLRQAGRVVTLVEDASQIKQASSSVVSRKMIEDNRPDQDHFLMHLIAMGAGEKFGFNKNGDHWPRTGLKHDTGNYGHHTFVKFGHYFEEHNNRDPKKARGSIKASFYNDDMDRVELLVWGHKKKAAEDYEAARQGKELSYSMSARVPWDRCSCCEKKAKSSRDYCEHAKHLMTQWSSAHRKFAFVYNDEPCFFDISKVKNPADRIAHHLEYLFSPEEMAKAAAANEFIFSDRQAERAGIILPNHRTGCSDPVSQGWLLKLAAMEEYLNRAAVEAGNVVKDEKFWFAKQAAVMAFDDSELTDKHLAALRKLEPDCLFRHLAKASAVLPFPFFYAYVTNKTVKEAAADPACRYAAEELLPRVFADLAEAPDDSETENLFKAASEFRTNYYAAEPETMAAIQEIAETYTIRRDNLSRRMTDKAASARPLERWEKSVGAVSDEDKVRAKRFASAYGLYKISFCEAATQLHGYGSLDEPEILVLTSQHNKSYGYTSRL